MPSEQQQKITEELLRILQEAEKLKENSDLQSETTEFLASECEKLESKTNDENLSFEEKELLSKQIVAMTKRLNNEVEIIESSIPKMDKLESKLDALIEEAKKSLNE